MISNRWHTTHRVAPGHWLIVRRTITGWVVEENVLGRVETLHGPSRERHEADVIAAAYTVAHLNGVVA